MKRKLSETEGAPFPKRTIPATSHQTPYAISDDEDSDDLGEVEALDLHDNSNAPPGCYAIQPVTIAAGTLRPGISVELHNGDFIRIKLIHRSRITGKVAAIGNLMRRARGADGMLESKLNELHFVLQSTKSNPNPALSDCLVTVALEDIRRVRKIVITNKRFPSASFRDSHQYKEGNGETLSKEEKAHIRKNSSLACRWMVVEELDGKKCTGGSIRRVNEEDTDDGARTSNQGRLRRHLGEERTSNLIRTHAARLQAKERAFVNLVDSPPLQSGRPGSRGDIIDLTNDNEEQSTSLQHELKESLSYISSSTSIRPQHRRLSAPASKRAPHNSSIKAHFSARKESRDGPRNTSAHTSLPQRSVRKASPELKRIHADICAGPGGMASGVQQAGSKLQFLLDKSKVACETLRLNFRTRVINQEIQPFFASEQGKEWVQVDTAHISYPCKAHSYLNRYDIDHNKNPDNIASGFATMKILERCKPRIVTFEQTPAIVTRNSGSFFHAIINELTSAGYDARWRVCNLAEYGNPQPRKRLIIIAACEGETLPTFPEPTHGLGPGKKPFVTVRDVLRKVQNYEGYVPDIMRHRQVRHGRPYDANAPLKGCITGNGGVTNLHPCGDYTFELRELTALQSFLLSHRFAGGVTAIREQIGDAVPSCFAMVLYEHINESLLDSDENFVKWIEDLKMVEGIELD